MKRAFSGNSNMRMETSPPDTLDRESIPSVALRRAIARKLVSLMSFNRAPLFGTD
jgi:hypothetical protein